MEHYLACHCCTVITGVLPCNGNYLLQWLDSSFTAIHQDPPVGHTLEQTVEWSHDTLPPWLTEMEVVLLPHISFAPNNNIALMALIWRRHPSFVPYWVGYNWLAVRGWSGGQQCSISDTRRYKSSDLAPRTTSLASATAHPPPNPQFTTTFSIVTIPTTTIPTTSLIAVAA